MNTRDYRNMGLAVLATAVLATGCLDRELKPLNPCLVSGVSRKVAVNNVDKVDLLFMVDNSNSMAQEQDSLKEQFPKLITVLTSGMRSADDQNPFPPAKDLHVGVVSSDMGIPGYELSSCHADGGDDGKLQHTPHGDGCEASYPTWLSYDAKAGTNAVMFAHDFQCIASLGTGGCGFEEQLESPLKALSPSVYMDENGNVDATKTIKFLSIARPGGMLGKGDVPVAQGGNLGFLRNDVTQGLSLIAIVVVTDEEDCSVRDTQHLHNGRDYPDDSPYKNEDINLRCFYNPQFSFDVKQRYLAGFQNLRPGNPNLVVFAAITGVPKDLVSQDVLDKVDFTDQGQRDQFYANILNDPLMQEQIDPSTNPGSGNGNLMTSCRRTDKMGLVSTAFPPRRIVQLAQAFGANGVVQSICQDDFGPAMDAIINVIARQLGEVCLPRALVRKRDGLVGCNVVWELPVPGTAPNSTPTQCDQAFLGPVDHGRAATNAAGGVNCKVAQLAVTDAKKGGNPPPGEGWFYDNYTADLVKTCSKTQQQRVAFTAMAKPPTGVTVKLECLNETQRLASTRTDLSLATVQPEIGTACGTDVTNTMGAQAAVSGDDACIVTLNNATQDKAMFCHPDLNTCVRQCNSTTDCPPAWVCDNRAETLADTNNRAYCVNPTCGADTGS
jgi:hypothetical protein